MNPTSNESANKRNTPNINAWSITVIITIVIVLLFSIAVFFIEKYQIPGIDQCAWGNFGDFIGGILVPLLSVFSFFLLIKTLISQIQSNSLVSDSNNLTQFNEMFKLLLDEYHSTIKEYSKDEKRGKEALKYFQDDILNKGKSSQGKIESRHNEGIREFESFYATYLPIASLQFKLLYRIINLIESSNIHEDRKQEVVKIIRCQFSEQELFFLRYNAYSRYGEKMQNYINMYNLLKHLPILSTFEFAKYASVIGDDTQVNIINNHLYTLRQETIKLLNNKGRNIYNKTVKLSNRYFAVLKVSDNYSEYCISINRIEKESSSEPIDLALDKLIKIELLVDFLSDYLKELFVYSNFGKINNSKSLKISSQQTNENEEGVITKMIFIATIKESEKRLCCTYFQGQ